MKKSSPLVFDNEQQSATDLDKLLAHGFKEGASRDALASTKGNLDLALKLLRTSSVDAQNGKDNAPSKLAWVGEVEGEWKDKDLGGGPMMGGMMSAEARALWKSPYYIRIGDYVRQVKDSSSKSNRDVRYSVTVIARDGGSWELTKSLSDFYSFWASLPFGMGLHSKLHLKTGFPLWKLNSLSLKTMFLGGFRSEMTDDEIEERRVLLENWVRELCLDEDCMTNAPFLACLELFVEAAQNHSSSASLSPTTTGNKKKSPLHAQPIGHDLLNWTKFPSHTTTGPFPVPYGGAMANLPTKLDLAEVFGENYHDSNATAESLTDKDVTVKQLAKDMSRDRVVIQGERFQGVDTSLDRLVMAGTRAAQRALEQKNALPLPEAAISDLSLRALRQISRTESAYISHTALSMAISLEECPDMAIVPESLLAEPLRIHFRVDDEKKSVSSPTNNSVVTSSTPQSTSVGGVVPTVDAQVLDVVGDCSRPVVVSSCSVVPTATPVETGHVHTRPPGVVPAASSNPFDFTDTSSSVPVTVSSSNTSKSPLFKNTTSNPQTTTPVGVSPLLKSNSSSNITKKTSAASQPLSPRSAATTSGAFFGSGSGSNSTATTGASGSAPMGSKKKMPLPTPGRRTLPSAPPHPASTGPLTAGAGSRSRHPVMEKTPANLICDLQATTVFRYTNIMNMQCVLQLRVTYCKSIKLIHNAADGSSLLQNDQESVCESEGERVRIVSEGIRETSDIKADGHDDKECGADVKSISPRSDKQPVFRSSKCFVILERATQTSSRDWRHDQHI